MLHLLAAIHFLLCGASSATPPTTSSRPGSAGALSGSGTQRPSTSPGSQAEQPDEEQQTSRRPVTRRGRLESSSAGATASRPTEADEMAGRGEDGASVSGLTTPPPDGLAPEGSTQQPAKGVLSKSTETLSVHDRVLNVVSEESAAAICRIFSGLAPGDSSISPWSSQMLWGTNQPQQSQWPLLSKIVTRLFWYVIHHCFPKLLLVSF